MNPRIILLAAVLGAAATLAGCGFRPLYAEGRGGSAENLASIRVEPIPDRIGQQLYTLLLARLTPRGVPARPDYILTVSLREATQDLAQRKDASATRSNLIIQASYNLSSTSRTAPIQIEGQATSINSYDRVASEFATLAAQEDARARSLRTLADEIRTRIAAALDNPQALKSASKAGAAQTRQQRELERRRNTPLGPFLPPTQ